MKIKRRSTTSMANNSSLRHDNINDILSRLPVKSIKRFQSVSKSWYHLFNSPAFISAHFRSSSRRPFLLIRRCHNPTGSHFSICLVDGRTSIIRDIRIPFLSSLIRFPKIIGSCNGLICLDISPCYTSGFILWNISTTQFAFLPKPRINDACKPIWMVASGFGYNCQAKDYKLVRIVNFHCIDDDLPVVRAEVYSWNLGSWRLIDGRMTEERIGSCVIHEGQQAVAIKGSLYWLANGVEKLVNYKFVVCFDMGSEEFMRIPIPDFYPSEICAKVLEFKESVALAFYPPMAVYPGYGRSMNRIEMWVFDDEEYGAHGNGKNWTKLHAIEMNSYALGVPIGVYNGSELLVKSVEGQCVSLCFFDPCNQSKKTLTVGSSEYTCEFYSYVDSLVPVTNAGDEQVEEAQE